MEFTSSLKAKAQQIIELSSRLGDRVHTWNQEEAAPRDGYTDRAGFVVFDDLELFADVYSAEGGTAGILRARMAWSPKGKNSQDIFTIITLDFTAALEKTKTIIADANILTPQALITLLNDSTTLPKLIHVSLESGKDAEGNGIGKRYEYTESTLEELTQSEKEEFLATLDKAYNYILSKI